MMENVASVILLISFFCYIAFIIKNKKHCTRKIFKTALIMCLYVGCILNLIRDPYFFLDSNNISTTVKTFMVPFCVSSFSAICGVKRNLSN